MAAHFGTVWEQTGKFHNLMFPFFLSITGQIDWHALVLPHPDQLFEA
jgi:hypothetical protein